ncbi:alkaline phosphatase D family protein [Lysinibacillus sp. SGAir0095]|uniref:alkaline phosphatase D family protein n=1 Tax=Lysinibacillus sp. SGAir0095 TaxID=2070463 RepID=UPI00143D4D55|nr:alkaline phosphatase D family protein [Lysinibacillus sp. SGAir0095]
MNSELFPALLAGPMIRRLDASKVFIWVATSKEFTISAEVCEIAKMGEKEFYSKIQSTTEKETIQFGENLFINLIKITPDSNLFPTNQLIGYNLHFQNQQDSFDLADLGLLSQDNSKSIVYDSFKYPTFFIPKKERVLAAKFLFGSCRKPQGEGEDTLAKADRLLVEHSRNLSERPEALFLMGDQIYADNVADPLFRPINQLGQALMGVQEKLTSIDKRIKGSLRDLKLINGRKEIVKDFASFSSRNGSNHLIEFGEYAAMYLLSWSPILWEVIREVNLLESFDEAFEKGQFHLKLAKATDKLKKLEKKQLQKRYIEHDKLISNCHSETYKIRRLFANIPTYMIFDDHDITDDWNINAEWKETVQNAPLGQHIVTNGQSAYFAFQGWGNEPEVFSHDFIFKIKRYFRDLQNNEMMNNYEEWINLLRDHQPWHFVTPTTPKAVFLDTRTLREYEDKPKTQASEQLVEERTFPPQLVNEHEYQAITKKLQKSGWQKGDPLIIISPTPVIGFDLIEKAILKFLPTLEKLGAHIQTIFDIEAWRYNGKGLTNLLNQLAEWNPINLVILSGDVHYSFLVTSSYTFSNGKELSIKQITSSPLKNKSFKNFGILVKATAALNQMLQQTEAIYRFCDPSYQIHDSEKNSLPEKDFLWKEKLLYDQISGNSIIETENTLGFLSYSANHVENRFVK